VCVWTHDANVLYEQKHSFNGFVSEHFDQAAYKLETFIANGFIVEIFDTSAEEKGLIVAVLLFLNSFNNKVRANSRSERYETLLHNLLHIRSLNETAQQFQGMES
jgi:hypothetical protein